MIHHSVPKTSYYLKQHVTRGSMQASPGIELLGCKSAYPINLHCARICLRCTQSIVLGACQQRTLSSVWRRSQPFNGCDNMLMRDDTGELCKSR